MSSNPARKSFVAPLLALDTRYHVPVLLAFAVLVRALVFHADQVIFSWRSTDMAGIALDYYRNGFRFFHPQVYWGGSGPGYVEMEFPIIPFLLAILYRLFGVHDLLALIIPLVSGLGLVVVVYLLGARVFDPATGLVAGIFAASPPPMAALSVGLWPDPPMLFFGAWGMYLLIRWVQKDSWGYMVGGALATALAILLKMTALYLGIPILYLCVVKYGPGFLKRTTVWLLAVLTLLPPALWYGYAHTLYLEYHNTFGILSGGFLKFANIQILLDPSFYILSLGRMIFYHFTAAAFVVFVYGMFLSQGTKLHYAFHVWFGAVVLYLLVAARGVSIGHYQYMLPVIPPGAVIAGFGTVAFLRKLDDMAVASRWSYRTVYVALLLAFLAGTVAATYVYESPEMYTTQMWNHDRRTGLAVGRVTSPGSLIMVVDNQMGGLPETIMTPPNVFYFSNRHGWYVALSWLSRDLIEQRKREGARYLVITANTISTFRMCCSEVQAYLSSHYTRILDSEEGVVYDLGASQGAGPTTG